jgi:hypothetical protein
MRPPVELLDFLKREDRYLIATHRIPTAMRSVRQ